MKRNLALLVLTLLLTLVVTGCGGTSNESQEGQKITVGVTGGPHERIAEKVKELALEEGIEIDVVVFNDFIQPNLQLADGALDINSFQHEPFLNKFMADRNLKLSVIGQTINFPMGIFSDKVEDVADLEPGSKIGIPNDPTNRARGLILLETAELIKLKEGVGVEATVQDVIENPKNFELVELEAPMLLRTLPDLGMAAINTNFVIDAGLDPIEESIFLEPKDNPWVCVVVVREGEEDNPLYKRFVEIYNSDEVKEFIDETFKGHVIAAW